VIYELSRSIHARTEIRFDPSQTISAEAYCFNNCYCRRRRRITHVLTRVEILHNVFYRARQVRLGKMVFRYLSTFQNIILFIDKNWIILLRTYYRYYCYRATYIYYYYYCFGTCCNRSAILTLQWQSTLVNTTVLYFYFIFLARKTVAHTHHARTNRLSADI